MTFDPPTAAVYRGASEIARLSVPREAQESGSVPYCCVTCGGTGVWRGHPDGEPRRCVPCSGRGTRRASL